MNKTAIITGAASGIGNGVAMKFLNEGYNVAAVDIIDAEKIKSTLDYDGEKLLCISADISKSEDRANILNKAVEKFGNVTVLVNVAGVAPLVRADLLEMTEESYDRVMNINTKGTMFLTQIVANHMVKNADKNSDFNGAIVNISSMSAYTSSVSRGEYCVSKAGVSMITTLFADRLSEYNITVNEIRPGIIKTNMTSTVKEKYDNLIGGGLLPIARWGLPEDIAKGVFVLSNGDLKYTTGQSVDVDGGFHIQRL